MKEIQKYLFDNIDSEYAIFQRRLLPNLDEKKILGVRTPILRQFAKEIVKAEYCDTFLSELPHMYFEENQLHGFIISSIKDFDECILKLELFLPQMDNWATTDQTSPKVFKKNKEKLLPYIDNWLKSKHTYTVRFAVGMYMTHFLDDDFKTDYIENVVKLRSEEYYINMEIAWYLATALAKAWKDVIPYIEDKKMDRWVHNKTIQKAIESNRITKEQKDYLRGLKI